MLREKKIKLIEHRRHASKNPTVELPNRTELSGTERKIQIFRAILLPCY